MQSHPPESVAPPMPMPPGEANWRRLMPVLLVVFIAALDLTVIAPILPGMISDLHISAVNADRYAWIVLAYLVAYTVTVPITGRVSDVYGRRSVFITALLLFLGGSVVVALAGTLELVIAGRVLQGLGGGAMLPVSMALVGDTVSLRRRAQALGIVAAVDTLGWVLGPLWGAAIPAVFGSWRAVFWINLPLGLLALLALRSMPRAVVSRARHLPSFASMLAGIVALLAFCLALSTGGEGGVARSEGANPLGAASNPLAAYQWPLLGIAAVALVGFVISERRTSRPLIPHALYRSAAFRAATVVNLVVGVGLIVAMVNAPLIVALLAKESMVDRYVALLLGAFTLAMSVGAVVGGRAMAPIGALSTTAIGLVVAGFGFASMFAWPDALPLGRMSVSLAVAGFGLGMVIAPVGEVALRAVSGTDYGVASGMVLLARLLGMTLGLAVLTAWGLRRLSAQIADLPEIAPLPGESTSNFFVRQQEFVNAEVIPLTLGVLREMLLVAGLLCVVALLATRWLARDTASPEPTEASPASAASDGVE